MRHGRTAARRRTTLRRSRFLVLIGVILGGLLLAGAGALGAGSASAATAAAPAATQAGSPTAADRCAARDSDDGTIHVRICLRDRRDGGNEPVAGVSITVSTLEGEEVGTGESDADGLVDIDLGETLDVLGNQYVIELDEETLPDGTALRNSDQLKVTTDPIQLETDYTATFPIGDALPEDLGPLTEAMQLAIGGLVFSSLLAMAALGLSMIFGTTGLTNFAHGELVTFGALIAWSVDRLPGAITLPGVGNVTIIVGVLVAFALGACFGWLNDIALWRPLRGRGTGLIPMMIVSIGLSMLLRNVFQYFGGGGSHNYSQYSDSVPWEVGPFLITPRDVTVFAVAIAVLCITCALLQYTRLGKATRAVADNPALAASSGINVQRVILVVWTSGAALAALAGALLGATQGFDYQTGFKLLLLIFAATVLGGLGTIWGSLVGAFIIGLFVEVSTVWVPAELKYVGALIVLILVLLVRPQGLLGRAQRVG